MARMMSTMDCMPRTKVPHFSRLATGQKKFIVVAYSKRKSRRNEPSDALTVTSLPVLEGEFVPLAVQQRNVKTATIETPCDDNLRLSLQEFLDSQKENVVDEHILSSPDVLHEVAKGNEDENDKLDNGVEEELDIDDAEEENFDELEGLPTLKKKGVPAVMRCFDRAKIFVKAGDGGKGEVAFRREKYIPFGGPCGGNGGKGGNVYVEVDRSLNSLLLFRKNIHFRAGRGAHGLGKSQHGGSGTDCVIKVPPGTLVREQSSSPGCGKLLLDEQKELLLLEGRGGRGNAAFKSGRNSSPQIAEKGEARPEMWIELELKLVADVGIIEESQMLAKTHY